MCAEAKSKVMQRVCLRSSIMTDITDANQWDRHGAPRTAQSGRRRRGTSARRCPSCPRYQLPGPPKGLFRPLCVCLRGGPFTCLCLPTFLGLQRPVCVSGTVAHLSSLGCGEALVPAERMRYPQEMASSSVSSTCSAGTTTAPWHCSTGGWHGKHWTSHSDEEDVAPKPPAAGT